MVKIGRNAPCPCGSGKKYKNCCLSRDEEERREKADRDKPYILLPKWDTKKDAIESMFRKIREEGFFPYIDEEDEEMVEIALVCPHGKSDESRIISKCEDDTWEWDGTSGSDMPCEICESNNKKLVRICPNCREPLPELSEDEAISFYKKGIDILNDTYCPKCGGKWLADKETLEQNFKIT